MMEAITTATITTEQEVRRVRAFVFVCTYKCLYGTIEISHCFDLTHKSLLLLSLCSHSGEAHSSHDTHMHNELEGEFSTLSNEATEDDKLPWGEVIGATLLVNLAALSGCLIVVMVAVHGKWLSMKGQDPTQTKVGHGLLFDICIPAFAVGALVATAVFLIFPEALHLIEGNFCLHLVSMSWVAFEPVSYLSYSVCLALCQRGAWSRRAL